MQKKLKEVPVQRPEETSAKRTPVRTIRLDDCSISIWARDATVRGAPMRFFSVTLERSYKDRDGGWKYTKSFDSESLGKVVSLCQQASVVIQMLQREPAEQQEAA